MIKQNLLGLFLAGLVICSSCQEDHLTKETAQKIESNKNFELLKQDIRKSQAWFEENHSVKIKKTSTATKGGSNQSKQFIGTPEWKIAGYVKYGPPSMPEFIRVPLHDYEVNAVWAKGMNPNGFRDLLLRDDGNGGYITDIIEIHPNLDYLKKKGLEGEDPMGTQMRTLISDADFCGFFLVYSIDNVLRYGERRVDGKIVSRLTGN